MADGLGDLQDIPKEELLHLCMKMNKRMAAIESKGKELLKRKNQLVTERQKLLLLIETAVKTSFNITPEQDADLNLIEKTFSDWDTDRLAKIKQYEFQIQELLAKESASIKSDQTTTDVSGPASMEAPLHLEKKDITSTDGRDYQALISKLEVELEKIKVNEKVLKEQLAIKDTSIQQKQTENDSLRKENELIKNNCEEKIVYMQMTIHQQKQKEELKQQEYLQLKNENEKFQHRLEEKEILLQTDKEMLVALQARLMEVEPELSSYKEKINDLDRRFSSLQVLKYEQDNVINTLKSDYKNILHEKEKILLKCKELEENKLKSDGQNSKIILLQEELNQCKEEMEEKTSIITRLRSEISNIEKNHAIRVAMLATSEAENNSLKETILQKENEILELANRITSLQIDYSTLENALKEKTEKFNSNIIQLEEQIIKEKKDYEQLVLTLKSQQEENMELMKKDFQKKSAMARSLLSEREEEVRVLSQKIKELQEEIASGAPTDRKIFELAQVQSKREALHGIHRDTREIAFQQLQSALAAKDFELAQSQQLLSDLTNEVSELRKVKQREGINMDYLKNVVFQYMTFPINSSERNALIPVLAMLLQFSPNEMMEIQKSVREPIWGNRPVKEVKRIDYANKPPTVITPPASYVPPSSSSRITNNSIPAPVSSARPVSSTSSTSGKSVPQPAVSSSNVAPNSSTQGLSQGGLKLKPVNHDYFVENENLGASKEFPSMSFDLNSPMYRGNPNGNNNSSLLVSNPPTPFTKPHSGSTSNNTHPVNNSASTGLTERKDSEVSENDFELRQKLKTITSDILDMSLSEDANGNNSNNTTNAANNANNGSSSGRLGNTFIIAQQALQNSRSNNVSANNLGGAGIPTLDMNYSSSSSNLNLPDLALPSPTTMHNAATVTTDDDGIRIKTTISGTSIDEHVFATNSKAL